jgi:hypothetical protein
MSRMLALALVIGFAGNAAAFELGIQAPAKSPVTYPENIPDPAHQGGDTIASAFLISWLPFSDQGTTVGYNNDYDEVCPYDGSNAPDVVYRYQATTADVVDIDLCDSNFDTKVFVYDAESNLVACNDDFYFAAPCFVYSSKLENVVFAAGQTYYIVIDGYGTASGVYALDVVPHVPCILNCPDDASYEGEPALGPGYVDNYNGGCNSPPSFPFQHIYGADIGSYLPYGSAILCGVSGWYLIGGSSTRDTDWFTFSRSSGLPIGITADAEYASYIFQLTGTCEGGVTVAQQAIAGPCLPAEMTIMSAGGNVWFWVGPTVFAAPGPDTSFDYVVWFTGVAPEGCVSAAPTTWGAVKALY